MAIAKTANIDLDIDDFNRIGENVPILANLKPHGEYLMFDLHKIGGTQIIMKKLQDLGLLYDDCITINGKTIKENLEGIEHKKIFMENKKLLKKIKDNSHIRILKGNLAPEGAVAKITGKEGDYFSGIAKVFNSESDFIKSLENGDIRKGMVIVIKFQGPKGGPGMPEMLKPTSAIVGYGLEKDVAFITDGRFSGGSHGFIVGHVSPEAYVGGPINKILDGDKITIDIKKNIINVDMDWKEFESRENVILDTRLNGYLKKFRDNVKGADKGCITD